jgi:hypothetical protein
MSINGLNEVVGRAIISDSFRAGLLNGRRAELLRQFETRLEPDEQQAVLVIQASDFADFAAAVERLIAQREGRRPAPRPEPAALPLARWSSLSASRLSLNCE